MRAINADELKDHQFHGCYTNIHIASNTDAYMLGWNDAIDAIVEHVPTVDAVKVVRCKDCKYYKSWEDTTTFCCSYHIAASYVRHSDDYCSRGERREDE